jgi:hypothetical protein
VCVKLTSRIKKKFRLYSIENIEEEINNLEPTVIGMGGI